MKQRKTKVKRGIAFMLAMLLIVCSFIDSGNGYVYADESEYQKAGDDVLETDLGILDEPETMENPEEDASTEVSTENVSWSGRFIYVDGTGETSELLQANGVGLESVDGELNADGSYDSRIHANSIAFTNGTTLTTVPVYNPDGSTAGTGPAVMWASFNVNGVERALSLFCIDHGAPAHNGDLFETVNEDTYLRLNRDQKIAISYVLGSSHAMKQAPNSGSGFNENINFDDWQVYYATQLMIWYYIYANKGTSGSANDGITWDQVVATCNHGYGSLSQCELIKAEVDSYYQVPSFAINKQLVGHVATPSYQLKYTGGGKYQIVLNNTNTACNLTYFFGSIGNATTATIGGTTVTYTRTAENQIKVTSDKMIPNSSKSNPISAERSFMPQMGGISYIANRSNPGNPDDPQDFIYCIDSKQGDPVGMVFDVYTESTGTIRVYKEAITAMNEPYSMKGAVYGIFKTKADAQANQNPVNYIVIDKKDSGGRWYGDAVNPVPFGTYYVRETETPHDDNGAIGHWKLDTTVYTVKVTKAYDPAINVGKTTDVTSKEQNYTAQIHVVKKSSLPGINNDQNSMVGAVYGVFKTQSAAEAASVDYATSDAAKAGVKKNGAIAVAIIGKHSDGVYGNANGLPLGTYYVKEVYAPNGWILDATIHKVDASSRNTSTYVTSKTVTSTETPEHGQIYVGKVKKTNPFEESGFDIGSDTDMTMAGAEYGVFKTKADAQAAQIKSYTDNSDYTDKRVTTIVVDKTDTTSALGGGPDLSGFSVYGISKELPRGTYYIVETKAPQGWLRDRTIYQKATSKKADSGVYYGLVSSQETEQSAAIEVYKTDATGTIRIADATLKGAKYGVYKEGRPGPTPTYERIENATIITDEAGYGYIEGVPVGIYYVKEEEPAPGYKLDPNWYPVEVTPDMVAGVTPAPKVESKESPILTDYEITKITVEDSHGMTNPTPLSGCTFSLYLKSDLDSNKLTYKDGKIALALSYDDSGNVITTGTALAGVKPYYTATTGADGKALFENCYKGNYIVVETKVGRRADGVRYRAIDPYEISLPIASGSSYKTKEAVTLTDEMIGSNIRIMKVDTKTGAKITGTATFKIYNLNTNTYIKMSVNGSLTDRFTTDKNGYITFDNRLPYGHYRLEEVEASNWYCLANLEINVADGYVEYRELDEDNQPGPWTKCYTAEENGVTFNIVRVGDTPHYVRVEKVDEDGKRLIGATLAIVHADTENQSPRRNADGSYDILQIAKMDNDKPVLKADGTFEMTDAIWKSEENLTVWAYVPEGDYYLVELEAPAGYVTAEPLAFHVSNNVKDITINGEQKRVDERDQTLTMMDRKLSVKISKQDITTGKELPGAILEVKNEKGELIERWTSTDQPHYLENITPGKYILTEILAPEGYSKAQSIEFVIKDSVADQKVVMKDELTHIEFLKVDENGQALAGATLEIHDLEGNVLESWESATEPHTVRGLAAGTYVLHEAAAPEGLLLADDIEFTVTDKPQVIKVTMTDKMIRGNFKLIKTSKQITGKRLQGATFSLYRSNPEGDEFLGLYVTDENGEINIYNLPYGDYYLKEERANARYYLNAETCRFEIRNNGETVIKNYENEAIAGRIIVHYEGTKDRGQSVVAHPQTGDAMRLRLNMILLCGITAGFLGFLCMRPVVRKRRKK